MSAPRIIDGVHAGARYLYPDATEVWGNARAGRLRMAGSIMRGLGGVLLSLVIVAGVLIVLLVGFPLAMAWEGPLPLIEGIISSGGVQFIFFALLLSILLRDVGQEILERDPISPSVASGEVVEIPRNLDLDSAPSSIHGVETNLFLHSAARINLLGEALAEVSRASASSSHRDRREKVDRIVSAARSRNDD